MNAARSEKWWCGLRWLLGVLLLWAAVSKLANPTEFLGSVLAYQFPLPKVFLQFVAVVLPWVELLCGLMLLADAWTESALACTLGLLGIFLIATGQAWARRLNISCGCFDLKVFGLQESHPHLVKFLESPAFAFLRNLALSTLAFLLLRRQLNLSAPAPAPSSPPPAPKPSKRPLPAKP